MKRNFLKFFAFFLFVMNAIYTPVCLATGVTVYFYNPENSIDNFVTLKNTFDSYLSEQGNYQFQPFDSPENLEDALTQKGHIYLLSSWYLNTLLLQKIPLHPVLIGTFQGNTKQRKILSAKQSISNFAMLKNATIAGSGSEPYIRSVLQEIDSEGYKKIAHTLNIHSISKDMDAVAAIGFGLAEAAVSSENSLKKFAEANPNDYKQLHTLGATEKNYLLIAATLNNPDANQLKVLKVLFNMPKNETSSKYLQLLGLDGWQWK